MIQYREILRQASLGMSQVQIAASCGCARKTVRTVVARAGERNVAWSSISEATDAEIERLLFPEKHPAESGRKMPDFVYIAKELTRPGVTLKLLWMEYCEECR